MSRIRNALILIITLSVIVFAFTACDRKGTINENLKPFIEITSYEGVDSAAVAQSGEALLFQQKIYWEAYDLDGTVDKFAFRVGYEDETTGEFRPYTDNAGNLVGVPDYTVIDEDGWVYHYQDGADETMPLELTTQKTIWTDQVYAVINFPANVNGDSTQVVNIFEVKCIDNNKEESDIARKYYKVTSRVPICTISSSKGAIDGEMIGTGIVFTFNIIDNDQFVGNEPDYFEFRLEKRDLLGNLIEGEDGYLDSTVWYSTRGQEDVGQYFVKVGNVNPDYPALLLDNIMNGIAQDSTYLIAKAIDLAGIVSDPDTVSFVVKEGFYPNTLIYDGIDQGEGTPTNTYDIMVLGENHYITQNPVTKIIPSVTTLTGTHYALPFWIDKDGNYTCIHSNDLKVYMHWGYRGEFEGNDPDAKAMAKVYDELTSSNYYSEIKYYDLRLDGEPYVYAPLPAAQYNFMDEDTGKEWLRVPVASTISQEVTLSGLEPGNHRFEVRAVDLQNEPDKTPSEFLFKIVSSVPALEKEGILVVDNTPHNQSWAPETITDSLYSELGFLADYTGTIDILDRKWLYDNVYVNRNYTSDVLSPTDLQKYKTIIYHADFYENMNLQSEANALDIYFQGGGNLIISGCANLSAMRSGLQNNGSSFLQKYFGIDYMEDDAIVAFKGAMMPFNPSYFKKAVAHNSSYSDITLDPDGFYSQITLPNFDSTALGPISYFPLDNLSINTEVLFTFGCKDPGDGLYDPSNQEYTFYSQQPVAIKSVNSNNNKCFMFGFPLSYMDEEAVSDMLMQIINDIEQ